MSAVSLLSVWGHGLSSHWSQEKHPQPFTIKPHQISGAFYEIIVRIIWRQTQKIYSVAAAKTLAYMSFMLRNYCSVKVDLLSNLLILPFLFSHTQVYARTQPRTQALLTVFLSGLIYSTHIFLWALLYVLSFLCLCLLEASRCPGLLVRGATGGYRRSGARALQLSCRSLGYRCAQGQSPTDRIGLRRKREGIC